MVEEEEGVGFGFQDRLGVSLLVRGGERWLLYHWFAFPFCPFPSIIKLSYLNPWVLLLLFFLFSPGFPLGLIGGGSELWAQHGLEWNVPLASSGHLCWLCPLPGSFSPPSCWWVGVKALVLCEHCSAISTTLLYSQHCSAASPKHSTIWATVKKVNSIPAR